jgi:hypothetical protein
MRNLAIWTLIFSSGCLLFPGSQPASREEDESIRFPDFRERFATIVGEQGQPYDLDGVTLQAITIAATDFIPSSAKDQQCELRQESHRYRVIRQGNIIFVSIYANPAACGGKLLMLDWGAKYAISTDGRILRRLFDGEPEDLSPDVSEQEPRGTPVPDSLVGSTHWGKADPTLPSAWFDGGTRRPTSESPPTPSPASDSPDAGSPGSDGGAQAPDGGSPGVPFPPSPPDAG